MSYVKSVEWLITSDSSDVQVKWWRYDTSPCNNGSQTEMDLEQDYVRRIQNEDQGSSIIKVV